jgi:hypothetical protein
MKLASRHLEKGFAVILAAVLALLLAPEFLLAQKSRETDAEKKLKNRTLGWTPPLVDSPFHSKISSPPCFLPSVL